VPEFGVPGPWSVGVSEGGGGRLIKVGVFISRIAWEMAKLWVLVFALIPLDIRCTPVGDVEGGLKRNRSAKGSNKECACTCISADQARPLRVRTSYYYRWCSTRPIFVVGSLAWTNVKEGICDTTRREFHRFKVPHAWLRQYWHLSLIQRRRYVLWTQKFYTIRDNDCRQDTAGIIFSGLRSSYEPLPPP
jgi:hypothetical protein